MLTQNLIGSLLEVFIQVLLNALDLPGLLELEPEQLSLDLSIQVDVDAKVLFNPLVHYFEREAKRKDDEKGDDGRQDRRHIVCLAGLLRLYQVACLILAPKDAHVLEHLALGWVVHVVA